ncbi:polyphenol oxidase family protein [Maridesulfovibrio zosterae]|uniref:polyphenol oxidase family protein n=1 Tax=Maridesulfovibrio zosterae TaxID=82171 RepID=UPI000414267D|nr:polyphenol oxidase family protein [Maridesulfovibrio zosterae]
MAELTYIPFVFPGLEKISVVFTTRNGGKCEAPFDEGNISFDVGDDPYNVRENRTALAATLGITQWHECKQVHGDVIHFEPECGSAGDPAILEGDGFATSAKGHGLVVKTADCQPILIAHKDGNFVAGLHNGWRGNAMNFPGKGVKRLCEHYSCNPSDLLAVRGPSLSPAVSEFKNFSTDFEPGFEAYFDEKSRMVDLWQLTRDQLQEAGLNPRNIYSIDMCTYSMSDTFFSYRRDHITGRQCSLIWIK